MPRERLRALRGRRVAMVFQDPMSTLNAVLKVSEQMRLALQAANQALSSANQALTEDNARLRSELAAARAIVDSFVNRLFGDPVDGNVAEAARAAALAKLTAARAAAPHDRRLRVAQNSYDHGQNAMRRKDWGRAAHEFRAAHEMAERILADRHGRKHHK